MSRWHGDSSRHILCRFAAFRHSLDTWRRSGCSECSNGGSCVSGIIRERQGASYVCSVCEGALLLAAAGLLDGYEATTHWAFTACLTERFPKVKVAPGHPRFWLDRNRLTGGGISSGLDEALELIRILKGKDVAQLVQQTTQYYPEPPVQSEIPPAGACPLPVRRGGSRHPD
jgi:transcriptional regulator GlxA family with amidase domain